MPHSADLGSPLCGNAQSFYKKVIADIHDIRNIQLIVKFNTKVSC
jgi:hypothetical protein